MNKFINIMGYGEVLDISRNNSRNSYGLVFLYIDILRGLVSSRIYAVKFYTLMNNPQKNCAEGETQYY